MEGKPWKRNELSYAVAGMSARSKAGRSSSKMLVSVVAISTLKMTYVKVRAVSRVATESSLSCRDRFLGAFVICSLLESCDSPSMYSSCSSSSRRRSMLCCVLASSSIPLVMACVVVAGVLLSMQRNRIELGVVVLSCIKVSWLSGPWRRRAWSGMLGAAELACMLVSSLGWGRGGGWALRSGGSWMGCGWFSAGVSHRDEGGS